MIRELIPAQVHDPGKGSFLVNPRPVKSANGVGIKMHRSRDGQLRPVYRAPHYYTKYSNTAVARDDAMDFVVIQ